MAATPILTDPIYHPLDPNNAAPVTPIQQMMIGGTMPYRSSYWSDFKTSIGLLPSNAPSLEEAIIRRENARGNFARRNMAGALSAVRGGSMIAAYGAGTMISGGVGGFAIGTVIDTAIGAAWNASGLGGMQEMIKNRAFIEDLGQIVARGTGATLSGHGFKSGDIGEIQSFMKDASKRFDVGLEDVQKEIGSFINAGLFRNVSNVDEFKKQFGQLKKNVSEIVKVLGASQEEGLALMAELNQSGISNSMVSLGLQGAQTMSRRTGISVSSFISAGAATAQSFQGTGLSADAGFQLGMTNLSNVQRGYQMGTISPNTMFQLGGSAENVAFAMTQTQMGFMNSPIGQMLLRGAMDPGGDINAQKLLNLSGAGVGAITAAAAQAMSGGGYQTFTNNQEQIKSNLIKNNPEMLNILMMTSMQNIAGQFGISPQTLGTTYGGFTNDTWRLTEGMLLSATPGGTMQERDLTRMANQGLAKQFRRSGSGYNRWWRNRGYELGQIVDTVSSPFASFGGNVLAGLEELSGPKDTIDFLDGDMEVAIRAIIKRGDSSKSIADMSYGGEIWYDRLGVDNSDIIFSAINQGIIDKDKINMRSLDDLYNNDGPIRTAIENKIGRGAYRRHKYNPDAMLRHVKEAMSGKPEYENVQFLQNKSLSTFFRGGEMQVIMNMPALEEEIRITNEVASLGRIYGQLDVSKREIVSEIGTDNISALREKLNENIVKNKDILKKYNTGDADQKLQMLMEHAGITEEQILEAKDPQAFINTLYLAAGNANLVIDTAGLVEMDLGVSPNTMKAYNKKVDKHRKSMTSKLNSALTEEWLDLSTRRYLRGDKMAHRLNEYFNAGDDDKKKNQVLAKMLNEAPDKNARREIARLFDKDGLEETMDALEYSFGEVEGADISRFEQLAIWKSELKEDQYGTGAKIDIEKTRELLIRGGVGSEAEIGALSSSKVADIGRLLALPSRGGIMTPGGAGISRPDSQAALNLSIALSLHALANRIDGGKNNRGLNLFSRIGSE